MFTIKVKIKISPTAISKYTIIFFFISLPFSLFALIIACAPNPQRTDIPKVHRKKNIDGPLNFFAIGIR